MNRPDFGETWQPEPIMPVILQETGEGALLFSTPPTERGSGRWSWGRVLRNGGGLGLIITALMIGGEYIIPHRVEPPGGLILYSLVSGLVIGFGLGYGLECLKFGRRPQK